MMVLIGVAIVIVVLVIAVLVAVHINRDEELSIKGGNKWFSLEVRKKKSLSSPSPPSAPSLGLPERHIDPEESQAGGEGRQVLTHDPSEDQDHR